MQVLLGKFKTIGCLNERLHASLGIGRSGARAQEDMPGVLASPHAAAQLMELRQTETLRILNEHDRCVGDVDTDLDDGGRDEHLNRTRLEIGHDLGFFLRLHATGEKPHLIGPKDTASKGASNFLGSLGVTGVLSRLKLKSRLVGLVALPCRSAHQGADHIGLATLSDLLEHSGIGIGTIALGDDLGSDTSAFHRARAQVATVKITVECQGHRARNGGGTHDEKVGAATLLTQRIALVHSESLLLVDDGKREAAKADILGKGRVRAEKHTGTALRETLENGLPLRFGRGAREQRPGNVRRIEQGPHLVGVLLGKHGRGGHEGSLAA